jgi:hypothetical protein
MRRDTLDASQPFRMHRVETVAGRVVDVDRRRATTMFKNPAQVRVPVVQRTQANHPREMFRPAIIPMPEPQLIGEERLREPHVDSLYTEQRGIHPRRSCQTW